MQLGIVVAGDPWRFFNEIFKDFESRYTVDIFQQRRFKAPIFNVRINRYLFHYDLESFLRKHDIVFFEWASDLLAAATSLPKRTRIITRLHRYEMFRWASKVNWQNVDRVILVSNAMRQKFAERFPEHVHKAVIMPVSVSTIKFRPVSKPYAGDLGTLCIITPRKRIYDLILAFADLNKIQGNFRLHIGGGGHKSADYMDAIQSLIRKLGLQDKVILYGNVTEPVNWYKNIDVFISNSFSEGLQVAPMEAMASARYCLSHYWDGAEELLPREQLFLTNSELQDKIMTYSELPESEKRRKQEEMREWACEKFDVELMKAQLRNLIEEVAQEPVLAVA